MAKPQKEIKTKLIDELDTKRVGKIDVNESMATGIVKTQLMASVEHAEETKKVIEETDKHIKAMRVIDIMNQMTHLGDALAKYLTDKQISGLVDLYKPIIDPLSKYVFKTTMIGQQWTAYGGYCTDKKDRCIFINTKTNVPLLELTRGKNDPSELNTDTILHVVRHKYGTFTHAFYRPSNIPGGFMDVDYFSMTYTEAALTAYSQFINNLLNNGGV